MNKKYYLLRMSYVKYDDNHYLLYLNEKRVDDYHPDNAGESAGDNKTVTAYSYEGDEPDGSTKIEAESANYNDFVAGIVRMKYSQNDVEAILCNHGDGNADHEKEFEDFQAWREQAKQWANEILDRDISHS
nr:MAG TPA: hypothetical protein [Caudoviricetes sp.]